MRDVSRVEYDAALERVIGSLCDKRACNHFPCTCDKATLAALGLDEPPTENAAGDDAKLRDLIATLWLYVGRNGWTHLTTEQKELFADVVDADPLMREHEGGFAVHRWWRDPVPLTESPKACPTCGGKNYVEIRCGDFSYDQPCPACGSGIDGGTP